jgi:hypothetical protein
VKLRVAALARRPDLWVEAVRAAFRLAGRNWWRRWPPLPTPDPAYLRWREQTAYGDAGASGGRAEDLVSFLEFCRAHRRGL